MKSSIESRFQKCSLAAPDRILVATDLTDTDYLVPHAIAQAKACGAEVTIVHAIPPSDIVPLEAGAIPYVDQWKIDRDVRIALLGIARQMEVEGVICDTVVRHGLSHEVIQELLHETGATRLILGTHARGTIGQFILGSVAHTLIPKVGTPVFIIGPHAREANHSLIPRRILHPVSLMGDYQDTVSLALDIAQTFRAELTLVHILERDTSKNINPGRTLEWAKNALAALVPDAASLVPPVHIRVSCGNLVEEVLKTAEKTKADWIVLGATGSSRTWSFGDSAAYQVIAAAECPVLTLRHEPHPMERRRLEEVHFTSPL